MDGISYGLVAGVWTSDLDWPQRLTAPLRCGQVFVAGYGAAGGVEVPFGGTKHSGYGREHGLAGLRAFTTKTAVTLTFGGRA